MEDTRPEWGKKFEGLFCIPQRVIVAIFGFLAIVNAYTMRVCLSVVITRLVVHRNITVSNDTGETFCTREETPKGDEDAKEVNVGTYTWSESKQGFILSSFYIGYLITHLPGGVLSEKFGGKYVLSLGILSTAIFTIMTPITIDMAGDNGLIVLRILMGFGEGTTFPALSALLSAWVPAKERATLGAFVLGGGQVGAILGNSISGILLHNYHWSWVFYVFGFAAVLWFILFTILCYSNAASHPFIKMKEKEYLMAEMGQIERRKDLPPTPWIPILTSLPMWGLISAQIGHDWGFYVMATDLPKYMNDVMQFSIKNNGFYSALPFGLMWFTSVASGPISDYILRSTSISITLIRKVNTSIAAFLPAIFMILASYAGCDRMLVVLSFTLCMGFMGTYYSGMKLTPLDMSPNYSGTVMAMTNGIGSMTGILAPTTVGWMTPNATMGEWRMVFWVAFTFLCVTAVIYDIWASGEIQPWNDPDQMPKNKPAPTA